VTDLCAINNDGGRAKLESERKKQREREREREREKRGFERVTIIALILEFDFSKK
jgi:hypothetical protein